MGDVFMASNCVLCGEKISFFSLYEITPKRLKVCPNCYYDYESIRCMKKSEDIYKKSEQIKHKYSQSSELEYYLSVVDNFYQKSLEMKPENDLAEQKRAEEKAIAAEKEKQKYAHYGPFTDKPYVYSIDGVRGKHIDIYNDKVVITTNVTVGSILAHNATDGEKTIYFSDCIGVQYKKSSFTVGYLQFETASSGGNNAASNFFHENSFTFDISVVSNEKMEEVVAFVKGRIDEVKRAANAPVQTATVAAPVAPHLIADELLKLKQLVDMGVLTQEEFDQQKKKILGQ